MADIKQINVGGVLYDIVARNNENLLINWDFKNFINQRENTTLTGVGYIGDCWKSTGATGSFSVGEDGITMSVPSTASTACYLCQWLEDDYTNKEITLSCVENGIVYSISGVVTKEDVLYKDLPSGVRLAFAYDTASNKQRYRVYIAVGIGETTTISKVKLEFGTGSTLTADQSVNRVAELAKCQRYYRRLKSAVNGSLTPMGIFYASSASAGFLVMDIGDMYTIPTITFSNMSSIVITKTASSSQYAIGSPTEFTVTYSKNTLHIQFSNFKKDDTNVTLTASTSYLCWMNVTGSYIELSAEL